MTRRTALTLPLGLWLAPQTQAAAGTDIVVLIEYSPGFAPVAASLIIPSIPPGNRIAVLGFHSKTKLLGKFTADPKQAEKSVRRASPRFQLGAGRAVQSKEIRLFDALHQAVKLFDGDTARQRAIVIVFGTDDCCEAPNQLPPGVRVIALATPPYLIDNWAGTVATPSTTPGQRLPKQGRMPDATIAKLRGLKAVIIEESGRPDLAKALEAARS